MILLTCDRVHVAWQMSRYLWSMKMAPTPASSQADWASPWIVTETQSILPRTVLPASKNDINTTMKTKYSSTLYSATKLIHSQIWLPNTWARTCKITQVWVLWAHPNTHFLKYNYKEYKCDIKKYSLYTRELHWDKFCSYPRPSPWLSSPSSPHPHSF